jgi:hypothetical protein
MSLALFGMDPSFQFYLKDPQSFRTLGNLFDSYLIITKLHFLVIILYFRFFRVEFARLLKKQKIGTLHKTDTSSLLDYAC